MELRTEILHSFDSVIELNARRHPPVSDIYRLRNLSQEWKNINTSKHLFPSEIWDVKPSWEVFLKVLSVLPVILIGSLANASLIYVILKVKTLQTTTNLLIVNMSIADLATCIICPVMFLCVDLYQNYILGPIGCRCDGVTVHALTLVAVFNLSAVSYDRVSAIVFNCSGKLTKRVTYFLLGISWIFGITIAAPLAHFRTYHERPWKNYLEMYCTEDTALVYPYWHIFSGLSVWAPLTIMAICYSAILIKLDRYESQALRSKYSTVIRYKGRIARVLSLVVLAFIICRVPFTALIIQRGQILHDTPSARRAESIYPLWYTSRYLVLVNAAINPLLYGCTSSSLRQQLAACPATSWLICQQKEEESKISSDTQPKRYGDLKPRSPCFGTNHNKRDAIPNISSTIEPMN